MICKSSHTGTHRTGHFKPQISLCFTGLLVAKGLELIGPGTLKCKKKQGVLPLEINIPGIPLAAVGKCDSPPPKKKQWLW